MFLGFDSKFKQNQKMLSCQIKISVWNTKAYVDRQFSLLKKNNQDFYSAYNFQKFCDFQICPWMGIRAVSEAKMENLYQ